MVVKVYISGISGNKEVKKRQQRVQMILESKNIEYETIDITEPGKESEKEFMQNNSKSKDSKYPLPPQIFNDEQYCGDYEEFDLANEIDELEKFLKVKAAVSTAEITLDKSQGRGSMQNGNTTSREPSTDKDVSVDEPGSTSERTSIAEENKDTDEKETEDLSKLTEAESKVTDEADNENENENEKGNDEENDNDNDNDNQGNNDDQSGGNEE